MSEFKERVIRETVRALWGEIGVPKEGIEILKIITNQRLSREFGRILWESIEPEKTNAPG